MLSPELKAVLDGLPAGQLHEVVEYAKRLLEDRSNPGPGVGQDTRAGTFDREHERYNCNLRATFLRHMAPPDPATGKMGVYEAVVNDLSKGGISLRTATQLEVGEVLTVFLKSDAYVEKKLFVEVRRCEGSGDHYDVGGMFVSQSAVIAAERARLTAGKNPS